jgi:hypothetical protein
VKARPGTLCQGLIRVAGLHPPAKVSLRTKKEYRFLTASAQFAADATLAGIVVSYGTNLKGSEIKGFGVSKVNPKMEAKSQPLRRWD